MRAGTMSRLDGGGVEFRIGREEYVVWRVDDNGWLRLDYRFRRRDHSSLAGLVFDLDPGQVDRLRWLGRGPYRVWGNRTAVGPLGVWTKDWNDAVTGVSWDYPEFKGFHAGVRWAELGIGDGRLLVVPGSHEHFLSVFRPTVPEGTASDGESMARNARAEAPEGLAILHGISAIGTKFHTASQLAPKPWRREPKRPVEGHLWLNVLPPALAAD